MMNRLLILGVLVLSSCGALLNNLNGPVLPAGSLQIQVVPPNTRGLGTVVPDLMAQVVSYRLSVGTDVRTSLIQGDLASQTGYTPGTYSLQVEALNLSGQVIMTHVPVSVTINSGANTPVSINLSGTQIGTGLAKVRFNLGSLGLGSVSDVKVRWATTVAGLGSATPTDLGAPLNDGQEYIEYINASLPSGISYLQFHFYGFDAAGGVGTAFAYSPLLTLVIFDNAESTIGYNITNSELDGRPLAPTAPTAPVLLLASASHNGNYLQLNWTDNSMVETGYRIYRKLAIDTVYPSTPLAELLPNNTTWEEPVIQPAQVSYAALVRGEIYTYKIVAFTSQYPQGSILEVTTPALEPVMAMYAHTGLITWESTFDVSAVGVMDVFTDSPTPKTYKIVVANVGFWPLTLSALQITGATSGDYLPSLLYTFDYGLQEPSNTLDNLAFARSLVSGEMLSIELRWKPSTSGIRTSTLEVTGDDLVSCPGGVSAKLYLQGESSIINDYAGRWDLDPILGAGQLSGSSPLIQQDRLGNITAELNIGGTSGLVGDRFTGPMDLASWNLSGGNGTDYLMVESGNPYNLSTGGTLSFWAGGYFNPGPSMVWTLINTLDSDSPTKGFALEIYTDGASVASWRLRTAGQGDLTLPYTNQLQRKWNLVTVNYDSVGQTFTLGVNETIIFNAARTLTQNVGDPIGLGSRPYDPGINHINQWKGPLDDLRIYSRSLTVLDRTRLFNENGGGAAALLIPPGQIAGMGYRALASGGSGKVFLTWDVTNLPAGDLEKVRVEIIGLSPAFGTVTKFFSAFSGVQENLIEDALWMTALGGQTVSITVYVRDRNYNESIGFTASPVTLQDAGNATGGIVNMTIPGNPDTINQTAFMSSNIKLEYSNDGLATSMPISPGMRPWFGKTDPLYIGKDLSFRLSPIFSSMRVGFTLDQHNWYLDGVLKVSTPIMTLTNGEWTAWGPSLHTLTYEFYSNPDGRWYSISTTFEIKE